MLNIRTAFSRDGVMWRKRGAADDPRNMFLLDGQLYARSLRVDALPASRVGREGDKFGRLETRERLTGTDWPYDVDPLPQIPFLITNTVRDLFSAFAVPTESQGTT